MNSKHHRKARFNGGRNEKRNISYVPQYKHDAWHKLFGIMTPHQIAKEINEKWIDPDYKLIVKPS